ncbi:hypothetical protein CVD28_03375 [Bacillus sp. M6-12]|uniref:hypothetical protein n=1 Tax=Bacillus sp. M6-12 TaxID=2054166 RepID=UPI000C79531C|nr:hypothetical protein [Bacillus sp. M6-12]PLS19470.1 hypothetical protein CVD28_03375 [Bacillus sp. M6-12]
MSYTIEYNKQVFYIEEGNEKLYFLFIRQGDNNVREADTNLRSKDWYLVEKGTEKDLWKYIGKRMGSVVGGGIQKSKGWEETEYFTPEDYIKQYRSKIKNAKPLDTMLDSFTMEAYIYLRDEFTNDKDKKVEATLRKFIQAYEMSSYGTYYYDKTKIGYSVSIKDTETLKDFLMNMPKGWQEDYQSGFKIEKHTTRRSRRWW